MAKTTRIFCFALMIMMMSFTVLLKSCSAKIYKVGDSDGWTAKDDTYHGWVERKAFHVGDSLFFEYDRNFNDVTQVSDPLEYEFCHSSSPKAIHKTGHDLVTLTKTGSYYFISSNQAQCLSGQKLNILVIRGPSLPIPLPPPSEILPFGKIHQVGDSKGWSVDVDYNKWSEEREFNVGDILLFVYGSELHDVLEISSDLEFNTCDHTSPQTVHKTGHDLVRLTKPGVHYFISSETAYCEAGLKLRVVVRPQPKAPKRMKPSAIDRLRKWLRTFRPKPHY